MQTASTLQPGDLDSFEQFLHTLPIESILLAKVPHPSSKANDTTFTTAASTLPTQADRTSIDDRNDSRAFHESDAISQSRSSGGGKYKPATAASVTVVKGSKSKKHIMS